VTVTGSGAFQRGFRMLNSGMVSGDSIMYALGSADSSKNMGQFYYYYGGANSNSSRISIGLHSVDDVFNIFGSSNVVIGSTSDNGAGKLQLAGHLVPTSNAVYNLGSASLRWNIVYSSDLSLKNEYGDYTLVEGEKDLYLYNNKLNKVFRFLLEEVDPSTAPPKKQE
jgi:hypothetical protein